jgi:nucleoside-diphosphate-sugar epimerase
MDVAVTGSSGTVGTAVLEHLGEEQGYEFTPIDAVEHPDHDTVVADVADYESLRPTFERQDAAVHLALNTDLNVSVTEVGWLPALAENLRATCTVLDAALDADLDAVVLASSNHVVGMYEEEHAPDLYFESDRLLDHTAPVRPDSPYGALKAFDEALGRFCAEYHGLRVYAIRIGSLRGPDRDDPYADAEAAVERGEMERGSAAYERRVARMKAMWHSRRDFAHMVDCCLAAEDVPFGLFYGVSDNDRRWLDIEHARETVGYDPRDNGEEWDGPARGP